MFLMTVSLAAVGADFDSDTVKTDTGDLVITCIGHGTLMFAFEDKIIHVDPFSRVADYTALPKADLILITHHHRDHLDLEAIKHIRRDGTRIVASQKAAEKLTGSTTLANGQSVEILGLKIEAVPAYNILHKRPGGEPFHIKGEGNGYVVTFGGKRIYIAGDTENTPEMKALRDIDVAFLPMNLPYTMTPEMVAEAARAFKPAVLYPYHYGKTDTSRLVHLLKDTEGVEVRIRRF
jgi:L-ascorbate metabolism protein UlaG (beta-lactamase superfamily)